MPTKYIDSGATISRDGKYRYMLWRRWEADKGRVLFVMLNPSTADGQDDDATILKCVSYAKAWDFGEICVVNLFAFRARHPSDLKAAEHPVGPKNDETILRQAARADKIVLAWGAHGKHRRRDLAVRTLLKGRDLWHLGITKGRQPKHPLYLRGDSAPQKWMLP